MPLEASLAAASTDVVLAGVTHWLSSPSGWRLSRAGAARMDEGGRSIAIFRDAFAAVQREAVAQGLTPAGAPTVAWMLQRQAVAHVMAASGERRHLWRGEERPVGDSRLFQLADAMGKTLAFLACHEPSLANANFAETQSYLRTTQHTLNIARKQHQRRELLRKSVIGHAQDLSLDEVRVVARFVQSELDRRTTSYRAPERHDQPGSPPDRRLFAQHHRDAWGFQTLLIVAWHLFQVGGRRGRRTPRLTCCASCAGAPPWKRASRHGPW